MNNVVSSSFLSLALLLSVQPVKASRDVQSPSDQVKTSEVAENVDASYVDLKRTRSKLEEVVLQASEWDKDQNSSLHLLRQYIQEGGSIGLKDAVLDSLGRAEQVILAQFDNQDIPQGRAEWAAENLNEIVEAIINNDLAVDASEVARACCPDEDPAQIIKVREKLYVLERAKFFEEVEMKKRVSLEGNLRVHGTAKIDTLSVVDETVLGLDLTVDGNININNSLDLATGNIVKNGVPFIHNFGTNNTFVGDNAGNFAMTGVNNSGFGVDALEFNTLGNANTGVGFEALQDNTTGSFNTAIGAGVLTFNTTGSYNTAMGVNALLNNTTGNNNTALGDSALGSNTTGNSNAAIGISALNLLTTGNNNVAVGTGAGFALTSSESNDIYISNLGVVGESDAIRIGTEGTQTKAFMAGVYATTTGSVTTLPVIVDINGQFGTTASTQSVKHDIADMNDDSELIYNLRPVSFVYNNDVSEAKQYGLIAEEVAEVFPALVAPDKEGQPYTVRYEVLPALLLNEVQKQQVQIDDMDRRLEALEARE